MGPPTVSGTLKVILTTYWQPLVSNVKKNFLLYLVQSSVFPVDVVKYFSDTLNLGFTFYARYLFFKWAGGML